MAQTSTIPVDVVSIADGFRQVADMFEQHPDESAGRRVPSIPVMLSIGVATVADVHQWAALLHTPVTVHENDIDTHTRTTSTLAGVEFSVVHIGPPATTLRRIVGLVAPDEVIGL